MDSALPVLDRLREQRATVHASFLILCEALAHAAVYEPGAVPDLMESWQARYTERAALDLAIASYDPQGSLFDDMAFPEED
jgi:hypothetical protein